MSPAIVDLGYGNIGSIMIAFERLGVRPTMTVEREALASATHVILPGVGAAGFAMARLGALGLADFLPTLTRPFLGICLGMQLMFDRSEEDDVACLGIIDGSVRRLQPAPGLPVPHMGWSRLSLRGPSIGPKDGDYVYFAHSFACDDGDSTLAIVEHGRPVPAIVRRGNFIGAQFHPERSGEPGASLLKAFLS